MEPSLKEKKGKILERCLSRYNHEVPGVFPKWRHSSEEGHENWNPDHHVTCLAGQTDSVDRASWRSPLSCPLTQGKAASRLNRFTLHLPPTRHRLMQRCDLRINGLFALCASSACGFRGSPKLGLHGQKNEELNTVENGLLSGRELGRQEFRWL